MSTRTSNKSTEEDWDVVSLTGSRQSVKGDQAAGAINDDTRYLNESTNGKSTLKRGSKLLRTFFNPVNLKRLSLTTGSTNSIDNDTEHPENSSQEESNDVKDETSRNSISSVTRLSSKLLALSLGGSSNANISKGAFPVLPKPPESPRLNKETLGIGYNEKKIVYRVGSNRTPDRSRGVALGDVILANEQTRHVVPDNARLSIFSERTSSLSRRSTKNSYSAFNSQRSYRDSRATSDLIPEVPCLPNGLCPYANITYDDREEQYDPANEDIDPVDPGDDGSKERQSRQVIPIIHNQVQVRSSQKLTSRSERSKGTAVVETHASRLPNRESKSPIYNRFQHLSRSADKGISNLVQVDRSDTVQLPKVTNAPLTHHEVFSSSSKPVASLYLVAGLPREPEAWTIADMSLTSRPPDHLTKAVPRFWRPVVLNSIAYGDANEISTSLDGNKGRDPASKGERNRAKLQQPKLDHSFHILSDDERKQIQRKAIKLAFNRNVEVVASTSQPASTIALFTFSVPIDSSTLGRFGSSAPSTDLESNLSSPTSRKVKNYHASALTIWSHADTSRSEAIALALSRDRKAKKKVVRSALKAASAGKKLEKILTKRMTLPAASAIEEGSAWIGSNPPSDTETEAEGFGTESEWGDHPLPAFPYQYRPGSVVPLFWLPYALVLVSEAPIYNLLSDMLRISWARHHQDILAHSLEMQRIVSYPAPKPGERLVMCASGETSQRASFVTTMPGVIDWHTGTSLDENFAMWPVFQALDAANLITIAEVALAPMGRVLFFSQHPIMLGLSVFTFQCILEMRGWKGVVYSMVHARDAAIHVDDAGPWLMGMPVQNRPIVFADLPKEVAVIDLDRNTVLLPKPYPRAISTGAVREKARKRLAAAIGQVPSYQVPEELTDAFPCGRFRPFSAVEVDGDFHEADRLIPKAPWTWDQCCVLTTFNSILAESPPSRFFNKLPKALQSRKTRRVRLLSGGTLHMQSVVRRHAAVFVDRRDLLETQIDRLNDKLAFLIGESRDWQHSFDVFKAFSDKLTAESADLKFRLEKERKAARQLSGQVANERNLQDKLVSDLAATEKAREDAIRQLESVKAVRQNLEFQRNLLISEMQSVLSADERSPIYDIALLRSEAASASSIGDNVSNRTSFETIGPLSYAGRRVSTPLPVTENADVTLNMDDYEEIRLGNVKVAVQQTLRSIQSRLAVVLQTAGQIEIAALSGHQDGQHDFVTSCVDEPSHREELYSVRSFSPPAEPVCDEDTLDLTQTEIAQASPGSVAFPPHETFPAKDAISNNPVYEILQPTSFKPRPFQLAPAGFGDAPTDSKITANYSQSSNWVSRSNVEESTFAKTLCDDKKRRFSSSPFYGKRQGDPNNTKRWSLSSYRHSADFTFHNSEDDITTSNGRYSRNSQVSTDGDDASFQSFSESEGYHSSDESTMWKSAADLTIYGNGATGLKK